MLISVTINSIADLIKTVIFASSTLGTLNLVKNYPNTDIANYGAEVQIYLDKISSVNLDSVTNKRVYKINIDILTNGGDKQSEGISNLNEILEKVVEKLEKFLPRMAMSVPNPNGVILDNNSIETAGLRVLDSKFLQKINIEVIEYVSTQ